MALADYSLSVGINHYPGLTPLQGAERDARIFHEWVLQHGVAPARAKLILSSDYAPPAAVAASAQPASQAIWDFFEMLRAAATANNAAGDGFVAGRRLYMFFSGHGFSPSIDTSGVLMANAERDTPHNLSPKAWGDRFYENGLFEEVILFQDACREPADDVDITPPYLKKSPMGGAQGRRRFYAMAAKSPLLALEKPIGGVVRGIFSVTLMEALSGAARDPASGDVTSDSLRQYLRDNMAARLTPQELEDQDLAQWPDVYGSDPLVIVRSQDFPPGPAGAPAAPPAFPVLIDMPGSQAGQVLDHNRQQVAGTPGGAAQWSLALPIGFYEIVLADSASRLFKVTGAVDANGQEEVVHVL